VVNVVGGHVDASTISDDDSVAKISPPESFSLIDLVARDSSGPNQLIDVLPRIERTVSS
jgi:hypothetical protein